MAMPDTKTELKSLFRSTRQPPNARVIEYQRSILELLGIEPSYGVEKLQAFIAANPNDREVFMKMQQYTMCAQVAMQEATMTDEQTAAFYRGIPEFMHHFPHIYMMQQQAQANPGAPMGPPTPESIARASLEALLATPEGREKLHALTSRMNRLKMDVEKEVPGMSASDRRDFFDSFKDDPLLASYGNFRIDSADRMNAFLAMSDESLYKMLKMQRVLAEDVNNGDGALARQLHEAEIQKQKKSQEECSMDHDHSHSHSHSHGHEHGPGCQHDEPSNKSSAPPSGTSYKMNR